jgi:hypothetical protein
LVLQVALGSGVKAELEARDRIAHPHAGSNFFVELSGFCPGIVADVVDRSQLSSSEMTVRLRNCLTRLAIVSFAPGLLISGSKVRVLDGPPITSATCRTSQVADAAYV